MTPGPRVTAAAALLVLGAAALMPRADGRPSEVTAVPGDAVARVRLLDSPAAVQLADRALGALVVDARMGTAQVADLALDADLDPTVRSYRAGDVTYWASGEKVVIFLTDGAAVPPEGLVPLGRVTDGLDHLAGCASDCTVHLDAATVSSGRDRPDGRTSSAERPDP